MEHIRTKNDLIQFAESNLSREHVSITRAFHTGIVENLGAFVHMDPISNNPGWILKITSKFKCVYYLAIIVYGLDYRAEIINSPPWEYWDGDQSNNKLYQGDNPKKYKLLRDKELRGNKNGW